MAVEERRLQPDLTGAHEFPTYALFIQTHRYRLEERPAFLPWDGRLEKLIEREGNGQGVPLRNPQVWDGFYTRIGGPIRNVFWMAWEDAFALKSLYAQAVAEREEVRMARSKRIEVYRGTVPQDAMDAFETWDEVADRISVYLDADNREELWAMLLPKGAEAQTVAASTNSGAASGKPAALGS